MSVEQDAYIFSGSSNIKLAKEISEVSGIKLGQLELLSFPDGELSVEIHESVRSKHCFVVQSLAKDPNNYLMELFVIIDALKRASAKSVTLLIPYLAYTRQDRKDHRRTPISAKLVANMIQTAGADHILAMDLHAEQLQGFFDIPMDHLHAKPLLVNSIEKSENLVVGAPDIGSIKYAKEVSDHFVADLVIIDKKRIHSSHIELSPIIGNVKEKNVLLVDDLCSSATTLVKAADALKRVGAKSVQAVITHGLFCDGAIEKIEKSQIEKIFVSNTICQDAYKDHPKIEVISIASIFGEAVRYIISKGSLLSLFAR